MYEFNKENLLFTFLVAYMIWWVVRPRPGRPMNLLCRGRHFAAVALALISMPTMVQLGATPRPVFWSFDGLVMQWVPISILFGVPAFLLGVVVQLVLNAYRFSSENSPTSVMEALHRVVHGNHAGRDVFNRPCGKCGKSCEADATFCRHCGTYIAHEGCKHCGAVIATSHKFCANCGQPNNL